MSMTIRFVAALSVLWVAPACSIQKSLEDSPTAPIVINTASGGVATGTGGSSATLATWASHTSELPTGAGCSHFAWQITAQTATSLSGSFSLLCLGAVTVQGTATGTLSGNTVSVTAQGSATGQGVPAGCTFTLTGGGTVENSSTLPLTFTAQTCLGPITGRETLRKSTPQSPAPAPPPPVEPPPPPPPTPAPPPAPSSPDAIDLRSATVVLGAAAIADWPITSTVTGTVAVDHDLCIYHTKLGQWPSGIFFGDPYTLLEGNQWVGALIGGRWYIGAADWYRPGQACKDVTADTIGHDAFYNPAWEPLRSWVPRRGEQFVMFASTPARMWPNMKTLDERSNVVFVTWNGS